MTLAVLASPDKAELFLTYRYVRGLVVPRQTRVRRVRRQVTTSVGNL